MNQLIKINGWKSRRIGAVPFYRCPACGHCQDVLFWGSSKLAECVGCHKQFPHRDFTEVRRNRVIVECCDCGRDMPLIPSTSGFLGYICSDCSNYVAIHYGNRAVQPSLVLDVNWNPALLDRAVPLSTGELCFACCKTTKDYLAVQVLQAIVKEEDSRFLFVRPKEHWTGLLLDSKRRKYLGFIVWTEAEYAVLRQIFIVEEERRKGHAEKLVRFWVERYADRLHPKFGIEAPNQKALSLHTKLGHIKVAGDSFRGIKCFLVPGF